MLKPIVLCTTAVLGLALIVMAGPRCVALRLPAAFAIGGMKAVELTVWVTVEQHADHRWLDVVAVDQDGFVVQRTQIQLDEHAARTQRPIVWKLNTGDYLIVAIVTKADGQQARASQPFHVS